MHIHRVIYMGTAAIAVPALEALAALDDLEVVAVCTQPDRPSGRNRKLSPSPVKVRALELGLQVLDPEQIGSAAAALQALEPDLGLVFAYGQYLPRAIFDLPTFGSLNFHPSRLPEYRGASPIQSALLDGKSESALSVLQVDARMDAGDLWLQVPMAIDPDDTSETLHARFGRLAGDLVPELIQGLREERLVRSPQDESRVVECGKIAKSDGRVDWQLPASVLRNRIRAFQPWPGVYVPWGGAGNLKILEADVAAASGPPGQVLECSGAGPLVACGEGSLRLTRLQPPGKRPMSGAEFLRGTSLQTGRLLEGA